MIEYMEELVETSVNLNYKSLEVLRSTLMPKTIFTREDVMQSRQAIANIAHELAVFLSALEASAEEDGGIDLNAYKQRRYH